jgi:hypothetical protein
MSLLLNAMEDCVVMNKEIVDDGYGGYIVRYTDGVHFNSAIVLNSSMQARIAEQQGVTALYTVTTTKALNLQYHDVFKRVSDGKIFRVTSDGDDNKTPTSATLDMRQVSAEEWRLPDGQSSDT